MINGSCLCGKIKYQINQEPVDCCYCHCAICRKLTGSLGGAYGAVLKNNFTWLTGQESITTFKPTTDTTRYFCSVCGSFLVSEHIEDQDNVYLSLGCIDDKITGIVEFHQFVAGKPDWVYLSDDIPHYSKWPK